MSSATHEDAELLVALAQWSTALGVGDSMPELFANSFDPDAAEAMDKPVRTMLTFGETIGTLVKHDLINAELVHDWLWLGGVWARVGPAAARLREQLGEPRLYENFEALVKAGPGA
jgi:hypothetical protein